MSPIKPLTDHDRDAVAREENRAKWATKRSPGIIVSVIAPGLRGVFFRRLASNRRSPPVDDGKVPTLCQQEVVVKRQRHDVPKQTLACTGLSMVVEEYSYSVLCRE